MTNVLVLSADTLVRFRNGRILVHTTASPMPAFETNQPMIVGWICRFASATDADASIATLPPDDRKGAAQILDYLTRSGVLVAAESREAQERSAPDSANLIHNHLRLLARSVYDLACDVLGLGSEASELALAKQSGIGLERRLLAALTSIDRLRNELAPLRRSRLQEQLADCGAGPASKGLQLHIGCGTGRLPGWINLDVHPAPFAMNVLWGLPFADGSTTRVFVSHMLEHLYFPRDVRFFLSELKRVMAPEGIVRIAVPNIEECIAAYAANDHGFFESRRETWSWWPENSTRLEGFLAYAGASTEPSYHFEAHKYGYDFETLAKVLREAGFERVRRSAYMASDDPVLRVDDVSAVAKARYGERHYSLFVEARTT